MTKTEVTGLLKDHAPEHSVGQLAGVEFMAATTGATPTAEIPYTQAVAGRTFEIGKVLDSDDDTARLMLVTMYAGTKSVNVYADVTGDNVQTERLGRLQTAGFDSTDADVFGATIKKVGTYYEAGTDTNGLTYEDEVSADAKAETVYSYVDDSGADPEVVTL